MPNFVPKITPIIGRMRRVPLRKGENDVEDGNEEGKSSNMLMGSNNCGLDVTKEGMRKHKEH